MPRKVRESRAEVAHAGFKYSMLIQWSDEDQAYLVSLPEWADRVNTPTTHGDTYEQAVRHGHEVLELLIEGALADGEPLPAPHIYSSIGA